MKFFGYILALLISVSSLSFGLNVDAIVPFDGASSPSGKFYYDLNDKYTIITGFSTIVPSSRNEETDVYFLFGFYHSMPIIKKVDLYATFFNSNGSGSSDSNIELQRLTVAKRWMQPLTERVTIGLEAILVQADVTGNEKVHLLPSIYPVVAITLDLLN